jgi:hypothetical protein
VVKLAQSQPRRFSNEVIRQGEAVIPLQYGVSSTFNQNETLLQTNKCASQKGKKDSFFDEKLNNRHDSVWPGTSDQPEHAIINLPSP